MGGDKMDSDSASEQEISDSEGGYSDKDADCKNVRLRVRLSGATSIVPCVIGRQLVSSLVPIIIGAR